MGKISKLPELEDERKPVRQARLVSPVDHPLDSPVDLQQALTAELRVSCPLCQGKGWILRAGFKHRTLHEAACHTCKGRGVIIAFPADDLVVMVESLRDLYQQTRRSLAVAVGE